MDEIRIEKMSQVIADLQNRPPERAGWSKPGKTTNEILEGRGFFVSYQSNEFLREVDRLHGDETPSFIDSAHPETALVIRKPWPFSAVERRFRHFGIARLTASLKSGKRLPLWYRVVNKAVEKCRTRFLILRGDHREAYEKLVPKGKRACVRYFEEQSAKDGAHFWSD